MGFSIGHRTGIIMSTGLGTYTPIPVILFDDWFLPSKDELTEINTQLFLYAVGDLRSNGGYASSSEFNASVAYFRIMGTVYPAGDYFGTKNDAFWVRPIRSFTSTINYNLRDIGPSGGWVFWKSGNNYLEASLIDLVGQVFPWSNIIDGLAGTGTAIGTGQANTTAIINQVGHITSAAKLCNDLVVIPNIISDIYTDGITQIRKQVRNSYFAIDKAITVLGFGGIENTDWKNIVTYNL